MTIMFLGCMYISLRIFFFHLQMSNRLPPCVNLKWCFADVSSFLADVSDVSALS